MSEETLSPEIQSVEVAAKTPLWWTLLMLFDYSVTLVKLSLLAFLIYLMRPAYLVLKEAASLQNNYYEIAIDNKHVNYQMVHTKPKDWVSLEEISKRLRGAIISSEDGKFYEHPGYDIVELTSAIEDAIRENFKRPRGASTITQQLVKNLFFESDRSYARKVQEFVMTLWIEKHVSKDKILETYLNVIEYGPEIYGIKNASMHYFGKKPANLTARESAFLAMLLPSPVRYYQSFRRKELTAFAERIVNSVLFKMRQGGYISESDYLTSLNDRFSWEKVQHVTEEAENPSDDFTDF